MTREKSNIKKPGFFANVTFQPIQKKSRANKGNSPVNPINAEKLSHFTINETHLKMYHQNMRGIRKNQQITKSNIS
jgi:hypothetical protein